MTQHTFPHLAPLFALAAILAAPLQAQNQVIIRKDTVVHVRKDTSVVTTRTTVETQRPGDRGMTTAAVLERLPNYRTLTRLLRQTHLLATLQGGAPITLFAPTDGAFASVSPAEMERLEGNPEALRKVLLKGMVSGRIDGNQMLKTRTVKTLNGVRLRVDYKNGHLRIDGHTIVEPGMRTSNGIINGIDGVIGAQ